MHKTRTTLALAACLFALTAQAESQGPLLKRAKCRLVQVYQAILSVIPIMKPVSSFLVQRLALDYRGDPGVTVGRVLLRGEGSPRPATDARVVLSRQGDTWYVLTAYPLE